MTSITIDTIEDSLGIRAAFYPHSDLDSTMRELSLQGAIEVAARRAYAEWVSEEPESRPSVEAELREALKTVCDGNDLAAERGESIKNWAESDARRMATRALAADERSWQPKGFPERVSVEGHFDKMTREAWTIFEGCLFAELFNRHFVTCDLPSIVADAKSFALEHS